MRFAGAIDPLGLLTVALARTDLGQDDTRRAVGGIDLDGMANLSQGLLPKTAPIIQERQIGPERRAPG